MHIILEGEKIIINNFVICFQIIFRFVFSMTTMHHNGVVNVISTPPTDDFTCENNLSYDIFKKEDHSTVSQSGPVPLDESVQ